MKIVLNTILAGLVMSIMIIGCNNASKKNITDANNNIKEAGKHIKEAVIVTNDTAKSNIKANWQSFRQTSDSAIAKMERKVATLERKIATANNTTKATLQTEVDKTKKKLQDVRKKLNKENDAFENDLNRIDATVESKNESFKQEFKRDMDQLGTAFKDLFKDNIK